MTRPPWTHPRLASGHGPAEGIVPDLIARYRQHYDEGTLPRGPRGIFYDLRPHGMGNGMTYRSPTALTP